MKALNFLVITFAVALAQATLPAIEMSACDITVFNANAQQAQALKDKGYIPTKVQLKDESDLEEGDSRLILAVTEIASSSTSTNANSKSQRSVELTFAQLTYFTKSTGIMSVVIGRFTKRGEVSEALDEAIATMPSCVVK